MHTPGTVPGPGAASRNRLGRTASVAGPGAMPSAVTGMPAPPAENDRPPFVRHELAVDEVRVADEVGEETAGGRLVELVRRALLRDPSTLHDDDVVGDGERLLLVVRHVDHGKR